MKRLVKLLPFAIVILFVPEAVYGQSFGRNRVIYEDFDFRIYKTPNFEIYHYLEDETELDEFARLCERWYKRHLEIFLDTLDERSPIILYNNHADFQQTTVVDQLMGIGTGGVTEGMRQRVVMPLSSSRRDTDHVLGHELTHVFHFRIFTGRRGTGQNRYSMQNVPLWMTEGQSEYLSIGSSDVQTAMWMRDAVKHDDIPTLTDMTERMHDYFPYRWGPAFWAFFANTFGDDMVLPLYTSSAMMGYERAIDTLTGIPADSLSGIWADNLRRTFEPQLDGRQAFAGKKLFDATNAGDMNIAPSLSPDGQNIVFISNKNVITLDFFLADVENREIKREITRMIRDTHIDEFNYLESAGTWNPDGSKFALTSFSGGRTVIIVADLDESETVLQIAPEGIKSLNNPDWSPDGRYIVFSGLSQGRSNLYLYDMETSEAQQLTDDRYTVLHPAWSPDGSKIAFITDREGNTDFDIIRYGNYRLAEYDMNTGNIEVIDVLPGADIFNPKYSPDGNNIFFISNADGFRNIYRYSKTRQEVKRITDIQTGVMGIGSLSPAIDIARESGDLVYILFSNGNHEIYSVNIDELDGPVIRDSDVDMSAASLILPGTHPEPLIVDRNLQDYTTIDDDQFDFEDYEPSLSLEAIGGMGVGAGVGRFGTGMSGGVSLFFGDMLREHRLITAVQAEGRILDIAGQVMYLNQTSRFNWGGAFSHMPYRSAYSFMRVDEVEGTPVQNLVMIEQRVFEQELGAIGQYPLSRQQRFEGGASGSLYSFRVDSINNYFIGNRLVDRSEYRLDAPESFFLSRLYLAFVGDGSIFGFTSPMRGYRYRFQAERTIGKFGFWGLTADYRQYRFFSPLALGFRIMHHGRYGRDADQIRPVYLGNPYFVRGYSFRQLHRPAETSNQFMNINNLTGSKIAVANAEIRYPFTGPEALALIESRMFFSDLVLFADGGLAWHDFDSVKTKWRPARDEDERIPVFSAGIALRINLFGAIIVEPYLALPFQRQADRTRGVFGFHLSMGGF